MVVVDEGGSGAFVFSHAPQRVTVFSVLAACLPVTGEQHAPTVDQVIEGGERDSRREKNRKRKQGCGGR